MKPAERKLAIKALQGQLAELKIACDGYAKEFEEEAMNRKEQSLIAHRWDIALKERRTLKFVLDCLELEEHKETKEI